MPARQLCRSHAHPRACAEPPPLPLCPTAPQALGGLRRCQAYQHGRRGPSTGFLQRVSAARGRAPAQPVLLLPGTQPGALAPASGLRSCRQQISRTPPGLRALRPPPPRSPSRARSHAYASVASCRMKPALGHAPARALRTSASASPSRKPSSCAQAGAGVGVAAPQRQHAADKSCSGHAHERRALGTCLAEQCSHHSST